MSNQTEAPKTPEGFVELCKTPRYFHARPGDVLRGYVCDRRKSSVGILVSEAFAHQSGENVGLIVHQVGDIVHLHFTDFEDFERLDAMLVGGSGDNDPIRTQEVTIRAWTDPDTGSIAFAIDMRNADAVLLQDALTMLAGKRAQIEQAKAAAAVTPPAVAPPTPAPEPAPMPAVDANAPRA